MKYGCCTNMLPRQNGSVGEEYIPALAMLGYDYVELPLGELTTVLNDSQRCELKKLLADNLPLYACNNFFTNDIRLCGPEPTRPEKTADYIKRALYTAAELETEIAVFGSPWAKYCPEGFSKSEAFKQLAQICGIIADEAGQYGITVVLEPNNKLETNMINNYEEARALALALGRPEIRLLQDYFHMKQEKISASCMSECADQLRHTHFARYDGRRFPGEPDEDPEYAEYFRTLKSIGYSGGISIEGFIESKENFRRDAANALRFLREMGSRADDGIL